MQMLPTQTLQPLPTEVLNNKFCDDVLRSLKAENKYLQSKYFYDDEGDRLFQQIMASPEYYPTDCEMEIFRQQTAQIASAIIGDGSPFNLIELGAGDATKSIHLLRLLVNNRVDFVYKPIDISGHVIDELNINLPAVLPDLKIEGLPGEYFDMLKVASADKSHRNVVLFLGSNIGNMPVEDAQGFCSLLRNHLRSNDMAFIGVDLKKNPQIILDAYNDKEGITRQFNLNLLTRINRELGADFNLSAFEHYPTYDPETGACKSYLVSKANQVVNICDESIGFKKDEIVFMEVSQKYSVAEVDALAVQAGFLPVMHFYDSKAWFLDTIWAVA